jgi:hypothetical protein
MKNSIVVFLFFASILTSQNSRAANLPFQEEAPEAVNLFYSDLAPYGEWIQFEPGLYAWHPLNVDPSWRPYARGRWVWSDYGWFWVTTEPFGWATYHYGRWYFDDAFGWIWIPDTVWGPAWVEWRCNDDYIGWAPLPPYARFHVTVGIRFTRRWIAPTAYWSFITYDHFVSGHPYHTFASGSSARRLITTTRSIGRYQIDQNRITNQGIERSLVQGRTSNRIETAEVSDTRERGVERLSSDGSRERIEIYRPRPEDSGTRNGRIEARRAETRPSLDFDRVDRYQTVPQQGARTSRGSNLRPQPGFELPGQPSQQPEQSLRKQEKSDIRRDRSLRPQPQFPAPNVNRATPNRSGGNKDQNRNGGRRRDRF